MDKTVVKRRIVVLIKQHFSDVLDTKQIDTNEKVDLFYGSVNMNSFTIMALLVKIEQEFDIMIDESDVSIEHMRSVDAIGDLVHKYLQA